MKYTHTADPVVITLGSAGLGAQAMARIMKTLNATISAPENAIIINGYEGANSFRFIFSAPQQQAAVKNVPPKYQISIAQMLSLKFLHTTAVISVDGTITAIAINERAIHEVIYSPFLISKNACEAYENTGMMSTLNSQNEKRASNECLPESNKRIARGLSHPG